MCAVQHPVVWAPSRRSLRAASMTAMRDKTDLGRNRRYDRFRPTAAIGSSRSEGRQRAYSIEKLQYFDFENFRQKHTFAEPQQGLPRKRPRSRNRA